ncbi:CerR family C-terminal domain-containing protein [Polaromonas sp. JS666]|uniref:CerR family C-terminal domain-containing protein n=1 Tax=Polaromonas sp. (strain JS666 / ATCC BAA-500) TaxID=296591 RepID=UPI000885641A|nr:CerR family C-terminal domain-containing protein [Polaromonas sp. JS666]SDN81544.1 DNA-binding transcriptional regulator, AcrR family [Polaromonas sp. JS666]
MNADPRPKTVSRAAGTEGEARKQRSDGAHARAHLLHAALRLFSEKGFAKTSIRDIAQAAGANVAAISYYFGDKAGLYRAVFTEPLGSARDDIALYDQPNFTLRQSLEGFFSGFLEPLRQGELVQLSTRLHFREMLEPTGLWAEEIDNGIKPAHAALVKVLCRHLGLSKADDEVHRLAFSITGLAIHMFISREVVDAIRPQLFGTPDAVEQWAASLVAYAEAMVAVETARREHLPDHLAAGMPHLKTASHEKT